MIITKERDEKNIGGKTEFPKLLLEEESVGVNELENNQGEHLSSGRIITFLLFCCFFLVTVYLQLNIETCYAMNTAIK